MKSHSIKQIAIILGVVALPLLLPRHALAYVPDVNIRVVNGITGAPIPNVWVREKNTPLGSNPGWSAFLNKCDGSASTQAISGRYMQTNGTGIASFVDPDLIPETTCNQQIDSNKDGTNDVVSFPCTPGKSIIDGSNCSAYGEFTCYGSPMTFEVVQPSGDAGTYTKLTNVTLPNSSADMLFTIYYTPAGSTPAPTPTPNLVTDATVKDVGTISGIGQKFQPLTELIEGQDYWVRIQVFNGGRGFSRVELHEVLNSTNFTLLLPAYGGAGNYTAGTFFVEGVVYGGLGWKMQDTTATDCPPGGGGFPSCISNYLNGGNKFTARAVDATNATTLPQKYFYFKVRAGAQTNGAKVKVDVDDTYPAHGGSYVDFIDRPDSQDNEPGVNNTQVVICPIGGCVNAATNGYFQVSKGDTYSNATGSEAIKSLLPANTYFSPDNASVVMQQGSAGNFGSGSVNAKNWYIKNYSVDSSLSYNKLYSDYSSRIVSKSIGGVNDFNATGYYTDSNAQSSPSKKYTLSGSNWTSTLSGKQVVFFLPGDLYINSNTDVATSNGSSIIYVVAGNVGISPSVTKFEGIVIADGVIDTACDSATGFVGSSCSTSASVANPLTLEGLYYAGGGFVLDRKASSGVSESFVGRPDFLLSTIATFGKNVYSWKEYAN